MKIIKRWGIRVDKKWWILGNNRKPAIYLKRGEATKEAADFNSGLKQKVYTVEEYK
jgi:hypothetical protein